MKMTQICLALALASQALPNNQFNFSYLNELSLAPSQWDHSLQDRQGLGAEFRKYFGAHHGVWLNASYALASGHEYTDFGDRYDLNLGRSFYGLGYAYRMPMGPFLASHFDLGLGLAGGTLKRTVLEAGESKTHDVDLGWGLAYQGAWGMDLNLGSMLVGAELEYKGSALDYQDQGAYSALDRVDKSLSLQSLGLGLKLGYQF